MSLSDSISKFFAGFRKDSPVNPSPLPTGYETNTVLYDQGDSQSIKQKNFLTEIKGWVFACINAIADEVATIQIKLYQSKVDGSVEEVYEHPVLDLLYRVNNFTTKYDHFWLTQTYLEAVGEAPWFVDIEQGTPVGIFFLQPSKLTPIPDSNKIIKGYRYEVSPGKRIELTPEEVIFLKYPNPANPFRGKGPMEAAAETIDLDNYAEKWNRSFFFNSAKPHSILKVKTNSMGDEQKKRLKATLEKDYRGIEKANGTMILWGDMDFTPFGVSQKDMDFNEQQKFGRDKILGIFRVPKAVIAQTDSVNFASANVAQHAFARWTIKPKMERLIQQLNEFLLPLFPGTEMMYLDFDNPVPDDDDLKIKRYDSGLTNGWMSPNEVRALEGLPPVEGGDVVNIGGTRVGFIPKGATANKLSTKSVNRDRINQMNARSKIFIKFEKKKATALKSIKEHLRKEFIAKKGKKSIPQWTPEIKANFIKVKAEIYTDFIPLVEKSQRKIFEEQKKNVLSNVKKIGKKKKDAIREDEITPVLLDKKKEKKRFLIYLAPIFAKIFDRSAKETSSFIGEDVSVTSEDEAAKKFIEEATTKVAYESTETTNQLLREEIRQGLDSGEGVADLAKRVNNVFTDATEARANMIARTETVRYNENATLEVYKESGVVEAKQWVIDPLTACEFCRAFDGKIVSIEGTFAEKGGTVTGEDGNLLDVSYEDIGTPPLHPNCNCTLAPIFIK